MSGSDLKAMKPGTIISPMIARAELVDRGDEPREDHYVHLYGVTWAELRDLAAYVAERLAAGND
jgi:hypothetical protein